MFHAFIRILFTNVKNIILNSTLLWSVNFPLTHVDRSYFIFLCFYSSAVLTRCLPSYIFISVNVFVFQYTKRRTPLTLAKHKERNPVLRARHCETAINSCQKHRLECYIIPLCYYVRHVIHCPPNLFHFSVNTMNYETALVCERVAAKMFYGRT